MATNNTSKPDKKAKFKSVTEDIPPEYILNLGNQKFIRFGGLLYLISLKGELRVQTTNILNTDTEVIYEAKAWLIPSDEYLASVGVSRDNPCVSLLMEPVVMHATSNGTNTSSNMIKFRHALAETRAVARALRILSGCPFTAVDELDRSDFKKLNTSNADFDEYGVSVQTMEEILHKENGSPQTTLPTVPSRKDCIVFLEEAKKNHKGVAEFLNSYLDARNAALPQNLPLKDLQEAYTKAKALMGDE